MQNAKIGVCEFSFPCWGPLAIEMAHRAGYDGMQLADAGGLENGFPLMNEFIRESYQEAAQLFGINFQAIHLHSLFHSHLIDNVPDSPLGIDARNSIKNGVEACRLMHIPVAMITITNVRSFEQYENICDALSYAQNLCRENGVQLVIETDLTPEQFHRLRERIGDGLKLCFDTMNPKVYGIGEPAELIRQYGMDVIDHFHVKDCCRNDRGFFLQSIQHRCG